MSLAEDPGGFTPELWERLVALGWTGMLVPGEGAGLLEMCIVLEQMGRVPLPGPFFSSSVMATRAAVALGADDLLAGLASGAQRGTVALHEQGHGNPLATVRARARRRGAGWVVTGTKPIVVDGHTADWAIVVALTEEGVRSFLLESPRAEVVPSLDPPASSRASSSTSSPPSRSVRSGDQAAIWREVLDDIAVALAAELIGVSDRALEEAVEYSKSASGLRPADRYLPDRSSIGSSTCTRVSSWHGPASTSPPGRPTPARPSAHRQRRWRRATQPKLRCGVTGDNIQVHGGVGFTWANDAHFLFKRAKQNEVLMGGSGQQFEHLAGMLVDRV